VLTGPDLEALLAAPSTPRSFEEPEWALMVRLLGPVEVITPDGSPVGFERGKSLELLAWLSTHRDRPTRVAARTALWELEVRDATFANVVSDARRALARAVQPAGGEEWVVRTLGDALPLHGLVRSDADLLRCRVEAARHLPAAEAIDVLRPGVALVRGLPFEGAGYLWPDAEGTTSELVVLATSAATSLAQHALTEGDVDTVFWATGQGLRVLPGHEELVALRMKAYAVHGDLAGVRMEWELYERTLHSDPWSFGEPSPKLVAIRRQLLSS
jgi:DNA-binding SARP family transcriptional activator